MTTDSCLGFSSASTGRRLPSFPLTFTCWRERTREGRSGESPGSPIYGRRTCLRTWAPQLRGGRSSSHVLREHRRCGRTRTAFVLALNTAGGSCGRSASTLPFRSRQLGSTLPRQRTLVALRTVRGWRFTSADAAGRKVPFDDEFSPRSPRRTTAALDGRGWRVCRPIGLAPNTPTSTPVPTVAPRRYLNWNPISHARQLHSVPGRSRPRPGGGRRSCS